MFKPPTFRLQNASRLAKMAVWAGAIMATKIPVGMKIYRRRAAIDPGSKSKKAPIVFGRLNHHVESLLGLIGDFVTALFVNFDVRDFF